MTSRAIRICFTAALRLRGAGEPALEDFTALLTSATLRADTAQMSESLKALLDRSLQATLAKSALQECAPTTAQALLTCGRCWSFLLRPGNACPSRSALCAAVASGLSVLTQSFPAVCCQLF